MPILYQQAQRRRHAPTFIQKYIREVSQVPANGLEIEQRMMHDMPSSTSDHCQPGQGEDAEITPKRGSKGFSRATFPSFHHMSLTIFHQFPMLAT